MEILPSFGGRIIHHLDVDPTRALYSAENTSGVILAVFPL
jgi:hypothetical protein